MPKKHEIQFLEEVQSKIIDYLAEPQNNVQDINDLPDKPSLTKHLDLKTPTKLKKINEIIDKYLSSALRTDSPNFYNQLFSGFSTMGFIGEMIATITNSSMYTFEMSPNATLIEKTLINKMSKLIGYKNGYGTFVNGGSNGNLIAMLSALNREYPNSKFNGLFGHETLVAFVSKESHYSFIKAGIQIGIGIDQVEMVPCDEKGHMDPILLKSMITETIKEGKRPFFVGATAGTTVRGNFDSIKQISKICGEFNIWLHIDGSWGGPALISKKYKHLLEGSEKSDSFTWCCHKMMGMPLVCTAIILKDKNILKNINDVQNTDYLFHHKNKDFDLGRFSLQCGRKVDSLKLFLAWKHFGDIGFEKRINNLFKLAKYAEWKVNQSANLKLISPVESLNICFQPQPQQLSKNDWNQFTISCRDEITNQGLVMVNYAYIDKICCIRLIIVNFEQKEKDIDRFFNLFDRTIVRLLRKISNE